MISYIILRGVHCHTATHGLGVLCNGLQRYLPAHLLPFLITHPPGSGKTYELLWSRMRGE